jgi:hypothetical protein
VKLILIISLAFITSSCGKLLKRDVVTVTENRPAVTNDPTFNTYTQTFAAKMAFQSKNPNFAIGDIPVIFRSPAQIASDTNSRINTVSAVCIQYAGGENLIEVSSDWWGAESESQRQLVIDHEMGHCRLGREHTDGQFTWKAISIMHSHILDRYDSRAKAQYETELYYKDAKPVVEFFKSLQII